jgi:hypothetical protein
MIIDTRYQPLACQESTGDGARLNETDDAKER